MTGRGKLVLIDGQSRSAIRGRRMWQAVAAMTVIRYYQRRKALAVKRETLAHERLEWPASRLVVEIPYLPLGIATTVVSTSFRL
jgi:hypothetical protein